MINCNVAISGNASLGATSTYFSAGTNSIIVKKIKNTIKKFDRRAQVFFTTQASVRGRKPMKADWGIARDDGFF